MAGSRTGRDMGLHNRDYARGSSSYGGGRSVTPSGGVLKKIIIATVAVFVLQILTQRNEIIALPGGMQAEISSDWVSSTFAVQLEKITSQGQVWRLLTYAFCHSRSDLLHIVFNLYLLWMLGREVEALYGSKEFAWFYAVSAVFAAVCYIVLGLVLAAVSGGGMFGSMLGASGAVTAVTMLYTLHYPRRKIYVWGIIGVEMRWLMGIVLFMDVYPLLGELLGFRLPDVTGSNVAHSAHIGGALFGWIYFARQLRLSSLVNGVGLGAIKRRSKEAKARRSNLKIFAPPAGSNASGPHSREPQVSGEQVDAILAKISEQGEESLSDREREILKEASRQYRGK